MKNDSERRKRWRERRSARLQRNRKGRRFKHAHVDSVKVEFVRSRPCVAAEVDGEFCNGRIECHHEGAPGERDDRKTFSVCALGHHREGEHSRHVLGPRRFAELVGKPLEQLCTEAERSYQQQVRPLPF